MFVPPRAALLPGVQLDAVRVGHEVRLQHVVRRGRVYSLPSPVK